MSIIIYKKTNCPWAAAVQAYLSTKEIPFEVRDMYQNPADKELVEKETGKFKSPTVHIDDIWYPDASVEQIAEAVKKHGYD